MTWRARQKNKTTGKVTLGSVFQKKTSKSVCKMKVISATAPSGHQALHWNYMKAGGGKTCETQFMPKHSLEVHFECYPHLPFSFPFKRCIYIKSWGCCSSVISLFSSFLCVLCYEIPVIPTPFPVLSCPPSLLQQFLGLWCTMLQTDAGFQLDKRAIQRSKCLRFQEGTHHLF